jgi:hypothetical protein
MRKVWDRDCQFDDNSHQFNISSSEVLKQGGGVVPQGTFGIFWRLYYCHKGKWYTVGIYLAEEREAC